MWDQFVIDPMVNALLVLYGFLGHNFVLAIAVFTILVKLLTLPLNLKQQRSMLGTQEMQPQIQAIQKKYKDNPQKMQEEFKRIGYNPTDSLMGCLPMLVQMPIMIGLYRAIIFVLGTTPLALFGLTQRVYSSIDLSQLLPINSHFLWLNLGAPDPLYILPVLVAGTMFLQQKVMAPDKKKDDGKKGNDKKDDPMAGMTQSMQYTMPLMFGFFALQFQAGLSVYFVLSNLIGIAQGVYVKKVMVVHKAEAAAAKRNKGSMVVEGEIVESMIPEPKAVPATASPKKKSGKNKKKRK
jgi:YidC/Oxa1 family membrane protein insertase